MRTSWMRGVAICCALWCGAPVFAQDEAEEEPFLPGLIAEFQQANSPPIVRLEAVVAGKWSDRPDERLRSLEPYTISYRGVLDVPDDGSYQLHVFADGDVQLSLNGKTLLTKEKLKGWASSSAQQLTFGPLPLEVKFTAHDRHTQVALFWSSDRFEREPIPARVLKHERAKVVSGEFQQGQVLARGWRCEGCHDRQHWKENDIPAPALDRLAGNLNRDWIVKSLTSPPPKVATSESPIDRRMPHFALPQSDAELLADWLLNPAAEQKPPDAEKPAKRDPKKPVPSREAGEQLLLTRGCLACHRVGQFGESGLFGGGDLTEIAAKRPASFFEQWLKDPSGLNRDHRMPVFDLTADERTSLALALSGRGKPVKSEAAAQKIDRKRASALARQNHCHHCHQLPIVEEERNTFVPAGGVVGLTALSNWKQSCAVAGITPKKTQAQFALSKESAAALQVYFSQRVRAEVKWTAEPTGEQLLIENNCLACHAREPQPAGVLPKKFGDKLVQLAEANADLAPQVAALTPPSLNSVGDKLTDAALEKAITRQGPAHRSYLQVQMPKFRLSQDEINQLAGHFIHIDRIPDYERTKPPEPTPAQLAARALAGKRLVGTDGFSCTACHQVGSVQPVKAPPNARGPTLSMPQDRLRRAWFDRWVRNPARIVPRMEMPSVQTPVRGVLQDNLHEQLAAVWDVLSTPGFEPPLPEPVRTLRFYSSEDNKDKQPLVITDLIEYEGKTLERAALIGLPNRQNVLFDFATNRLLSWSQGDLARQRTKGKNWYWEQAGSPLLNPKVKDAELALEIDGRIYEGTTNGQWLADPGTTTFKPNSVSFSYPLLFRQVDDQSGAGTRDLVVQQSVELSDKATGPSFVRRYSLERFPTFGRLYWRIFDASAPEVDAERDIKETAEGLTIQIKGRAEIQISVDPAALLEWHQDGGVVIKPKSLKTGSKLIVSASYRSLLPADEYHAPRAPEVSFLQPPVVIAPGFSGHRLPLPAGVMPTAVDMRRNGNLLVASLKGQVFEVLRPNGEIKFLADGLAAPYGIKAFAKDADEDVDVVTKNALVRISTVKYGQTTIATLAAGWGYTADYHDWCVGLPRDNKGNYYIALPCFQDNRPAPAQRLRGSVLKLTPYVGGRQYDMEVISRGHRFPMGMALNAKGELFVSDNQGNYNPFNELNFVRKDKHFGFVNKGQDRPAVTDSPAIEIPHPWTRSVNGICVLTTPELQRRRDKDLTIFGPLEGHLVGCEYDTRRLIRMSLQKVNGEYQGCAYPLTIPTPVEEAPLGPICCEVSPSGELVIGSLRDSGWGAANNIGEVITVDVDPAKFGHGLAEMRAIAGGFELEFFSPVEKELAENLENYSLSSYRRESTPAYGGNDIDRRTEKVAAVSLSENRRRATLKLDSLRAGHVYELRLKSLAPEGELFLPAEAHYTLRQLVK